MISDNLNFAASGMGVGVAGVGVGVAGVGVGIVGVGVGVVGVGVGVGVGGIGLGVGVGVSEGIGVDVGKKREKETLIVLPASAVKEPLHRVNPNFVIAYEYVFPASNSITHSAYVVSPTWLVMHVCPVPVIVTVASAAANHWPVITPGCETLKVTLATSLGIGVSLGVGVGVGGVGVGSA